MQQVDVTVVVPCYNEELLLEKNVREVVNTLSNAGYSHEIIFVDDCSRDNTRSIILTLVKQLPNASHIFNEQNIGRGGTFMVGARKAQGKYIGFLDIDLEVSAEYLPAVLGKLSDGAQICTVDRKYELSGPPMFVIRGLLSKGYKKLCRMILKLPYRDTETGYKFFERNALFSIMDKTQNRHWFWDTEIMALAYLQNMKVVEIPGVFRKKKEKVSTVRIIPDTLNYFAELLRFRKRMKRM